MHAVRRTWALFLLATLGTCVGTPLTGLANEPTVVSRSELDRALTEHTTRADHAREVVRDFLDRPEVRAMAGDLRLDLRRAADAVATLEGAELEELAAHAGHARTHLAGGSSTGTIFPWWMGLVYLALLGLLLFVTIRAIF